MTENYQEALKKLSLFFLSNPALFNGQSYKKQKGSETSHQSLFRPRNKFRKIPLFVIYYLIPLPFDLLNQEIVERKGKNTKN